MVHFKRLQTWWKYIFIQYGELFPYFFVLTVFVSLVA